MLLSRQKYTYYFGPWIKNTQKRITMSSPIAEYTALSNQIVEFRSDIKNCMRALKTLIECVI